MGMVAAVNTRPVGLDVATAFPTGVSVDRRGRDDSADHSLVHTHFPGTGAYPLISLTNGPMPAVSPPSTTSSAPLTKLASSLAR